MSSTTMEVCIDSVESAVNAEMGGANRLELCACLGEGGTTPTLGMLRIVKKSTKLPVFVMIRPRGGDFLYSNNEFRIMKEDIRILKEGGSDGFVFGILTPEGCIDAKRVEELISLSRPLPVTFHRAFDMIKEPSDCLETLIQLGVDRLLTSGCEQNAFKGAPLIKSLVKQANGQISIMPGGGITEDNLEQILTETGVNEFHCSARVSVESRMVYRNEQVCMGTSHGSSEFSLKTTGVDRVKRLVAIASHGTR
ncbi:copper homeostasis protein cutC homolog isoform X3 [Halichondria panicea]|uniref:copper homeostasis protein cutC homolog isoform X3 n=1 Tax=Halichondria panicea TaxID=6063 RepID=UPI00312BA81E